MTARREEVVVRLAAAYRRAAAGEPAALELAAIDLEFEPTDDERAEAKRRWRATVVDNRDWFTEPGASKSRHLRVVKDEEDDA